MTDTQADIVNAIVSAIARWATHHQPTIAGIALVGSRANQTAQKDSDIDIMILTSTPHSFRTQTDWIAEIAWPTAIGPLTHWRDQTYGVVWSRHLSFQSGSIVELSFGSPSWANTDPIDAGTLQVIQNGCQPIYDPHKLLAQLTAKASPH